jgi:hypothetical protein
MATRPAERTGEGQSLMLVVSSKVRGASIGSARSRQASYFKHYLRHEKQQLSSNRTSRPSNGDGRDPLAELALIVGSSIHPEAAD